MEMPVSIPGDGVYYHGTYTEAHGLYTVVIAEPHGRFTLAAPATDGMRSVLYHVRRRSFEILLSVEAFT